jgi:hypothetical protein
MTGRGSRAPSSQPVRLAFPCFEAQWQEVTPRVYRLGLTPDEAGRRTKMREFYTC